MTEDNVDVEVSDDTSDEEPKEVVPQSELKKDWKRYRVVSKPEGNPTFKDPNTGVERQYIRITEGKFASKKDAQRLTEFSNYDVHVEHDEPLYEIVSVKEVD